MLRAALAAALAALLLLAPAAGPATAAPPDCAVKDASGRCIIGAEDPGGPSDDKPGTPGNGGGGSSGPRVCTEWTDEDVIECSNELGTWSQSRKCYLELADPQPPLDDPVWEGNTDGVVYQCMIPNPAGSSYWTTYVWQATAEPGPAPRELADQAIAQMDFRAGQLGMNPGADALSVVGLQTWLWIADPDESTVGPMTRSASAGAVTVTATARLDEVEWDMGEGSVTCDGPGTPYGPTSGAGESPTCGYTYTRSSAGRPGQAYTVTATSRWVVEWAGGGESGEIPLEFSRSADIRVAEIQTLVTGS